MSKVTLVDNTDIVLRQMATNCEAGMQAVGEMLVEAVQEQMLYGYHDPHGNPPHTEIVETGATFDSISAEVSRDSQNAFTLSVGAGTSWAPFVHDGTRFLRGRPFLTDGVMGKKAEVASILAGKLPNGINT